MESVINGRGKYYVNANANADADADANTMYGKAKKKS